MFLDDVGFVYSVAGNCFHAVEVPRQHLMICGCYKPVLIIFLRFESYLVSGLTTGSVKGSKKAINVLKMNDRGDLRCQPAVSILISGTGTQVLQMGLWHLDKAEHGFSFVVKCSMVEWAAHCFSAK